MSDKYRNQRGYGGRDEMDELADDAGRMSVNDADRGYGRSERRGNGYEGQRSGYGGNRRGCDYGEGGYGRGDETSTGGGGGRGYGGGGKDRADDDGKYREDSGQGSRRGRGSGGYGGGGGHDDGGYGDKGYGTRRGGRGDEYGEGDGKRGTGYEKSGGYGDGGRGYGKSSGYGDNDGYGSKKDDDRSGGYGQGGGYGKSSRGGYGGDKDGYGAKKDDDRNEGYGQGGGYGKSSRGGYGDNDGYGAKKDGSGGYGKSYGDNDGYGAKKDNSGGYGKSYGDNAGYGEKKEDGGGYGKSSGYGDNAGYGAKKDGGGGYGKSSGYGDNDGYGAKKDGGGGYGKSSGYGDNAGYGGKKEDGGGYGGQGYGKSGGDGYGGGDAAAAGVDGEERPPPVTYVPEEVDCSEDAIFSHGVRQGINFSQYNDVAVKVTGGVQGVGVGGVGGPCDRFADFNLDSQLMSNIRRSGYDVPTPIQKYSIPIVLSGCDLMACAQTGSGKTAAFILPIMDRILKEGIQVPKSTPYAVIIMPTRELVVQTHQTCLRFAFNTSVRIAMLYGGVAVRHQASQLRMGCHIVVATTGRLLDMINREWISLSDCQFLVLDEADRMLDMGFERDLSRIVESGKISTDRLTMMFSATFPAEVQTLAQTYLKKDYAFISAGIVGGACADVVQEFIQVDRSSKREKIKEVLSELGKTKTLIFVEQKRFADFLGSDLSQAGFSATTIHGDRPQKEREDAMRDFVKGNATCLVATNVAARGIDVPGVDNVINYDIPGDITEYVHRIGRTGRCGNVGKSISFYDSSDSKCQQIASNLVSVLKDAKQQVPQFLLDDAGMGSGGGGGGWLGGNEGGGGGYGAEGFDERGQMHGAFDVRPFMDDDSNKPKLSDYVDAKADEKWD